MPPLNKTQNINILSEYGDLRETVNESKHVLLVTHEKPDGDAIGSVCAMAGWLHSQGKSFTLFCADPVPSGLRFIVFSEHFVGSCEEAIKKIPDTVVFLDVSDPKRAKAEDIISKLKNHRYTKVVIDHHATYTPGADINIHDPGASSTCEVLYDMFSFLGYEFSEQEATALLAGIVSDTENCTNHATSTKTVAISHTLVVSGADTATTSNIIRRSRTMDNIKAIGAGFNRLYHNKSAGVIVSLFRASDTEVFGDGSFYGFPNLLKRTNSGKIIIVIQEYGDGVIQGSLRSVDTRIDVARLARIFPGGGGHKLAAGFSCSAKLVRQNGKWKII